MTRWLFVLLLASTLAIACSQKSGSQPPVTGQQPEAAQPPATAAQQPEATQQPPASQQGPSTQPAQGSQPAAESERTPERPTLERQETPAAKAPRASVPPSSAGSGRARPSPAAPPLTGRAQPPEAEAPSQPTAPPKPQFREVTIPARTALSVKLATPIASDTSKVEDRVRGTLTTPIVISGTTVVPAGAEVVGSILEATPSGKVKGRASVVFRFNQLMVRNDTHEILTRRIVRQAASTKGEDAKKVGIGAGIGAAIGAAIGGGKGAAIGGAVGAGTGTGAVLATRGAEVRLPEGTTINTTLQEAVTLAVPVD